MLGRSWALQKQILPCRRLQGEARPKPTSPHLTVYFPVHLMNQGSDAAWPRAACPDQTPDYGRFLNFAHMTGPQGDVNIKHTPPHLQHIHLVQRENHSGLLLGLMEVYRNSNESIITALKAESLIVDVITWQPSSEMYPLSPAPEEQAQLPHVPFPQTTYHFFQHLSVRTGSAKEIRWVISHHKVILSLLSLFAVT